MPRFRDVLFCCFLAAAMFLGGCAMFRKAEQEHLYQLQIKCPPGPANIVHNIPEIMST